MAESGTPHAVSPCDWCGRQGHVRELRDVAFGRVLAQDPVLCDICAALFIVDGIRDASIRRESAIDLAFARLTGAADSDLLDTRITKAVETRTRELEVELNRARALIVSLREELQRGPSGSEIDRLVERFMESD